MKNIVLKNTIIFFTLISLWGCDIYTDISQELIVCNKQELIILHFDTPSDTTYQKIWSWKQEDDTVLPDSLHQLLFSIDECKPVNQAQQILITASWKGGAALIDRETKNILFYAIIPNAHSAEILPNNRIVVAGSIAKGGNCLAVYNLDRSNEILFIDSIYSGHGVIWDNKREILWALGYDELRVYTLKDWNSSYPSLNLVKSYKIPGISGHDLQAIPNSSYLLITENENTWMFNRDSEEFKIYEPLKGNKKVKSIMIHPVNKQLVFIKVDSITAQSETIYFKNPERSVFLKDHKLYKARWIK